MKLTLEEQNPLMDLDIPITLKVRDLIKLNQILARTYDEEESLRETLGPILQEIKTVIQETESNPEWINLRKWDSNLELLDEAGKKQKKHLKRIKRALLKQRNLRIVYCAPGSGEITRRTIIPMDLWESDSYWLLRAYCYLMGEEHTFRVDRILKVKEKAPGKKRPTAMTKGHEDDSIALDLEIDSVDDTEDDIAYEPEPDIAEEPEEDAEWFDEIETEHDEPIAESGNNAAKSVIPGNRNKHYSLPGKKPHQHGLPNRLERLIKRVERKSP